MKMLLSIDRLRCGRTRRRCGPPSTARAAMRLDAMRLDATQRDSAQPDAIARGIRRRSERRVIAAPTAIAALIAVSAARAAALRP
ncbi:hypothetical protein AQ921_22290 [Burkholderia pseudomallei]|nr:hypothetical protein AQ921_22290 [Burkholderia pseudomallei]